MGSGAANLDGDQWVETANCGLERCEERVLVREHSKMAWLDPDAGSRRDVLLAGFEPRISLRLMVDKE